MSNPPPSPSRPGPNLSSASSPAGGEETRHRDLTEALALFPWESLATAAAIYIFGTTQRDPLDGAESVFLSYLTLWILTTAGLVATGLRRHDTPLAWIGLGCVLTIWVVHQGPHRGAVLSTFLLAAAVWAGQATVRRGEPAGRGAAILTWTALAASWQGLMHSADVVLPWTSERLATWLAMPLLVGLAAALLQGPVGAPATFVILASAYFVGPGLTWPLVACLVGLAAGAAVAQRRRLGPRFFIFIRSAIGPTWGFVALGMLALWTVPTLYPWLRPAPFDVFRTLPGVGSALALLAFIGTMTFLASRSGAGLKQILPFTLATVAVAVAALPLPRTEVLSEGRPQVLTASRPRLEWPLPPGPLRSVVVEADLVHGAELEPHSLALRVLWQQGDRKLLDTFLRSGVDLDDWASGRKDLASRPGRPKVPAWHHRVSADGSFFSRTFRADLAPRPFRIGQVSDHSEIAILDEGRGSVVILQRPKGLPPEVAVRIHRLEVRR